MSTMLMRRSAARLLEGRYALDESLLREASTRGIAAVQTEADDATWNFLGKRFFKRAGGIRTVLHRILRSKYSHYDINAWLRMYDLHLLSHAQLINFFLQSGAPSSFHTILDIGTGDGHIAENVLMPMLSGDHSESNALVVTETSRELCRRLALKGLQVYNVDVTTEQIGRWGHASFGLVSLLNVLDRTECALGLLTAASRLLQEQGYILVATPLPFAPDAPGKIGTHAGTLDAASWGREAVTFLNSVQESHPQLQPVGLTRLPYMSYGDVRQSIYMRDDLMLLLRKEAR